MPEKFLDFINMAAILTACRLESYLKNNNSNNARFHGKLTRFVSKFEKLSVNYFADYFEENMAKASVSKKRYYYLLKLFGTEYRNVAETLLGLSLLYAIYPEVREGFKEAGIVVSINTAYRLENNEDCSAYDASKLFEALYPIFLPSPKENDWYSEVNFKADRRLLDYLLGKDDFSIKSEENIMLFSADSGLSDLYLYQDICNKLSPLFNENGSILQLRGEEKCGKKFLIKHIAKKCGKSVLFADFKILSDMKNSIEIEEYVSLILRETLFYNAVVCWHNVKKEFFNEKEWSIKKFTDFCMNYFLRRNVKVCCCIEQTVDLASDFSCRIYVYDFPQLSQHERIFLWKQFCIEHNQKEIDPVQFAIRYKFSCGQIAEVFQRRNIYTYIKEETEKHIFEKICVQIAAPSEKLFNILHSDYKLSDIMLPEREMNTIKEICNNFQYYYKVYTEWNMQSKMPYGRAVSVLLCGPPGTGKSMTAHVIANQLELPLFHVDLSQISDKYIGETEKHLEAVFTEAEKSNCVLLLDEADAICGKRSEVHDSKDRYANNDTAFLLQRLEWYDGIVILATNFVNNIDSAFMRRMKYIIQFSVPNTDIRKKIWLSCFQEKLPLDSEVDFDYLAEQFDFSGANIKNVVLAASFLAAAENKSVNMYHILRSVGNEYLKFQKNILPGEFGKYSDIYFKIFDKH